MANLALSLALALVAAPAVASEAKQTPFSHRRHAPLKLKCAVCHRAADKQERAGFPTLAECRSCHVDMTGRSIPAVRVYRVADFVNFSHAAHLAGKAECRDCHGDVFKQDTLTIERPPTMVACVACHKERKATLVCNACHELGQ